jgi:hypothetical protein
MLHQPHQSVSVACSGRAVMSVLAPRIFINMTRVKNTTRVSTTPFSLTRIFSQNAAIDTGFACHLVQRHVSFHGTWAYMEYQTEANLFLTGTRC